jgi:Ca2+-binding EF-hand superfamily protein
MDDDNSKTLSLVEFTKACRDFRIGIAEEYIPTIFNAFDLNNDGTLSIDEFVIAIRGVMNEKRTQIVTQAYRKLDKDGNGVINLLDIRDLYKADRHPDVIQGKRT